MVIEGKERKVATDAQFLIYYDRRMTLIYLKLKKKKKMKGEWEYIARGQGLAGYFGPMSPCWLMT